MEWPIGQQVRLQGLSRGELNGRCAAVVEGAVAAGRVPVVLESEGDEVFQPRTTQLSVKTENLARLDAVGPFTLTITGRDYLPANGCRPAELMQTRFLPGVTGGTHKRRFRTLEHAVRAADIYGSCFDSGVPCELVDAAGRHPIPEDMPGCGNNANDGLVQLYNGLGHGQLEPCSVALERRLEQQKQAQLAAPALCRVWRGPARLERSDGTRIVVDASSVMLEHFDPRYLNGICIPQKTVFRVFRGRAADDLRSTLADAFRSPRPAPPSWEWLREAWPVFCKQGNPSVGLCMLGSLHTRWVITTYGLSGARRRCDAAQAPGSQPMLDLAQVLGSPNVVLDRELLGKADETVIFDSGHWGAEPNQAAGQIFREFCD